MSEQEMTRNMERMARAAVCDGIRMLWREVSEDELQRRVAFLRNMVLNNTDCPPEEYSRWCKVRVLRERTSPYGGLVSVKITGIAARVLLALPWSWATYIAEVHYKAWSDEAFAGATDTFVDKVYETDDIGQMKASFIGKDKRRQKTNKGASKGARLGSKKSDVQAVTYRRHGERTGHEVKIQDALLFRIWSECSAAAGDFFPSLSDEQVWRLYQGKGARVGFARFFAELKRRGIRFTDFFSTAASSPDPADAVPFEFNLDTREDTLIGL